MITRTIDTKKYTLEKIDYDLVGGNESLYLQFKIEQDVEFGVRTYYYGMTVTPENTQAFLGILGGAFTDAVIERLINENA